jgi:hypothetical protein
VVAGSDLLQHTQTPFRRYHGEHPLRDSAGALFFVVIAEHREPPLTFECVLLPPVVSP